VHAATKTGTVYVSSTSCGTTDGCFSTAVPITAPANTLGNFLSLPATPNSLVFNPLGGKAYLGTNSGRFGSVGLAVLDATGNSVSELSNLPGKVLAVSPDGTKVIISDTAPADGPNQVFVLDTTANTGPAFQITGATAADFSPDSLKAYIVAGTNLYVYSTLEALKTVPLGASPAIDVSFLANGAFAYLATVDIDAAHASLRGERDKRRVVVVNVAAAQTVLFLRQHDDATALRSFVCQ